MKPRLTTVQGCESETPNRRLHEPGWGVRINLGKEVVGKEVGAGYEGRYFINLGGEFGRVRSSARAETEILERIGVFWSGARRHGHLGGVSSEALEATASQRSESCTIPGEVTLTDSSSPKTIRLAGSTILWVSLALLCLGLAAVFAWWELRGYQRHESFKANSAVTTATIREFERAYGGVEEKTYAHWIDYEVHRGLLVLSRRLEVGERIQVIYDKTNPSNVHALEVYRPEFRGPETSTIEGTIALLLLVSAGALYNAYRRSRGHSAGT